MYYSPCKEVQACNYRSETSEGDKTQTQLKNHLPWKQRDPSLGAGGSFTPCSGFGLCRNVHPLKGQEVSIHLPEHRSPSENQHPNAPLHLHPHTPPVQNRGCTAPPVPLHHPVKCRESKTHWQTRSTGTDCNRAAPRNEGWKIKHLPKIKFCILKMGNLNNAKKRAEG